jgi:hypothetical protein
MRDWSFRLEPVSTKASPTGSNLRSASTLVNYHRRSPNSFTGTTSKSHALSPLYYDYTEDFNFEVAGNGEGASGDTRSPTSFIHDKTLGEIGKSPLRRPQSMTLVHKDRQPGWIFMLWFHRRTGIAWKHQMTNLG